jgi:hypothetical protein
MSDKPETPQEPRPGPRKEFEDPHYHDEDEVAPPDDDSPGEPRRSPKKPAHRIPPPRKRFHED